MRKKKMEMIVPEILKNENTGYVYEYIPQYLIQPTQLTIYDGQGNEIFYCEDMPFGYIVVGKKLGS